MFFKKNKIVLDCYTWFAHAHNYYPISKSKNHLPTWWKDLPPTYKDPQSIVPIPTMKTCAGFNDFFRQGFIMPMWTDTALTTRPGMMGQGGSGIAQFADNLTNVDTHKPIQWGGYWDQNEYTQAKIVSPWVLKCNEDIPFMWVKADWNFEHPEELIIPPGTLEFKYQSNSHINLFFKRNTPDGSLNTVHIPAGQPLVHLIPLTERKVEIRTHLVSHDEWKSMYGDSNHPFWHNSYNKTKKIKKDKKRASKCPFGFRSNT